MTLTAEVTEQTVPSRTLVLATLTGPQAGDRLTPIRYHDGFVFLPKQVERRFGYDDLAHHVTHSAAYIAGVDHLVVRGEALRDLKILLNRVAAADACPELALPSMVGRLVLITTSGLLAVALRSNKPAVLQYRLWLTKTVWPQLYSTDYQRLIQPFSVMNTSGTTLTTLQAEFRAALELATTCGCVGNQALLAANGTVYRKYQFDVLAALQRDLLCDSQVLYLSPTELGERFTPAVSATAINEALVQAGWQTAWRTAAGKLYYELTSAGMAYGQFYDTARLHNSGVPAQQLKWQHDAAFYLHRLGYIKAELLGYNNVERSLKAIKG